MTERQPNPRPALQPVTPEHLNLNAMAPVMGSFPLEFDGFTWEKLDVKCVQCESIIDPDQVRGRVDQSFKGVVLIDAIATCLSCALSMPVMHRFYDHGRPTELNHQNHLFGGK